MENGREFSLEEQAEMEKTDLLNKKLSGTSTTEFAFLCTFYKFRNKTEEKGEMSVLGMLKYFNEAKELLILMREDGFVLVLTDERVEKIKALFEYEKSKNGKNYE